MHSRQGRAVAKIVEVRFLSLFEILSPSKLSLASALQPFPLSSSAAKPRDRARAARNRVRIEGDNARD